VHADDEHFDRESKRDRHVCFTLQSLFSGGDEDYCHVSR